MPVDKALNIALRNIVRRDLRTVSVQDLPDPAFVDDTPEESVARFREQGLLPSKREEAQRRRPRPPTFTQGTIEFPWFRGQGLGTGSIRSLGPLPEAGVIKEINVNFSTDAGTGIGNMFFAVKIAQGDIPAGTILFGADYDRATKIWQPNDAEEPDLSGFQMAFRALADRTETRVLDLNFPVPITPASLIARTLNVQVAAGTLVATIMVSVIYDVTPDIASSTIFIPSFRRSNITASTRGARRRSTTRSTPRAVVVSVTQGGSIINERTIAWESASANIKRDWFNRQVGAESDPNIRFIP